MKLERFNFKDNKTPLTTTEKNEIRNRNRVVILCYLGGNEGASMTQCIYTVHHLLFGVVKEYIEITDLLKEVMISVVPAVNIEQLRVIENEFKASQTIPVKIKNTRSFGGNCAPNNY